MEMIQKDFTVTSLQIAEWMQAFTKKKAEHKEVMRKIRRILDGAEIPPSSFESFYVNSQNKQQPMYILPKRETLLVVSKFDDKLRLQLIDKVLEIEETAKVDIPQELVEMFVPKTGYMEENKKGMLKTKPIRGYWRVDKDTEYNRLMQRRYELAKIAGGLIDVNKEMRELDHRIQEMEAKI